MAGGNVRAIKALRKNRNRARLANKSSSSTGNVPRSLVNIGYVVPERIITRMVYGSVIARTPGAATDQYLYLINSTLDPDSTGGGHQPLGRDQLLGTLYNKYRVHSVDVTVDISALPVSGSPCVMSLSFTNDSSTFGLFDGIEQPNSVYKFQRDPSNGFKCQMRKKINLWDLWGKTKAEYLSDDITGALYSASPSEQMYARVACATADASVITVWTFAVKLDMEVEVYDRFAITSS